MENQKMMKGESGNLDSNRDKYLTLDSQVFILKNEGDSQVSEAYSLSSRTYMSISYLIGAAQMCQRVRYFERGVGLLSAEQATRREQHQAYVVSSIMLTTMFLEASINELYGDVNEGLLSGRLESDFTKKLKAIGTTLDVGSSTSVGVLTKYRLILDIAGVTDFPWAERPAQDIQPIISLRNALVHYKPVSHVISSGLDAPPIDKKKLEKLLTGKFNLNPLESVDNMSFFPDRCLSFECAKFCFETILKFTDAFYSRLGGEIPYEHVRDLATI